MLSLHNLQMKTNGNKIMNDYLKHLLLLLLVVSCSRTEEHSADTVDEIIPQVHSQEEANISAERLSEYDSLPSYVGDINTSVTENISLQNSTDDVNATHKYISCSLNFGGGAVQLVNDTELIKLLTPDTNITSKEAPGNCLIVLFYSKYCPFSSMAAPHFNALPRAFPHIKMVAINAMMYHLFNTQNGIVGVPSLLLFHNGRPVGKFNDSEYTLDLFSKFITKYTGIYPEKKSYVTSADFSGPVASVPSKETDIFLGISWTFILICSIYYFTKSKWWKWIVETVQNTWRESEAQAQHEHVE